MATALNKAQIVAGTLAKWKRELDKATASVAAGNLNSWTIEALAEAAARKNSTILLTRVMERLSEAALIETQDVLGTIYPITVLDDDKANEIIDGAADHIEEQILRWYKPNATSVISVEIELHSHRADIEALKALRGENF